MSSKPILVIAEGERAERAFLDAIKNAFHFSYTFCCLRGNIYHLYTRMKAVDFNADVKSILLEMHPEYRNELDARFAYTYLVFDMDPHHTKGRDDREIDDVVEENSRAIREMTRYFIDETDPSVGKLYVNYPMLESFRCCDSTFDELYRSELVRLEDISSFKRYAGTKKMARKHLKDYDKIDFMQLVKQNVYKLNWLHTRSWSKMTYGQYLSYCEQETILAGQLRLIEDDRMVAVLNTSLFLILDYYGNRDGFYDAVLG